MKDTAPISQGILAVAALFGVVGGGVAMVVMDYGMLSALLIGLLIALLVIVVLALGWRDPKPNPMNAPAPVAKVAEPAPVAKAAEAAPVAKAAAPAAAPVAAAPAAALVSAPVAAPAEKPKAAPKPKAEAAAKPKAEAAPKPKAKAEPAPKPAAEKPAARPVAADGKPEMLSGPRAGGADDLKQIKGVGPKLEQLLHSMGIFHFDQVAGWRNREVKWVDENLEGFKGRVTRDDWVKQAKILARGGKTEFAERVKKGDVY